jgi:hypothetical protein
MKPSTDITSAAMIFRMSGVLSSVSWDQAIVDLEPAHL